MNPLNKIKAYYTRFFHKTEWNKLEYGYYDKVDDIISAVKENFDALDYYIKKAEYKTFIYFRNEEDLTYIKLIEVKKEPALVLNGNTFVSGGTVLITNQINAIQNGVYSISHIGTAQLGIYSGTSVNQGLSSPLNGLFPFSLDDLE